MHWSARSALGKTLTAPGRALSADSQPQQFGDQVSAGLASEAVELKADRLPDVVSLEAEHTGGGQL
jgi:hypothetical protein